ncbi:CLUMA_CG003595, isoform A [Clunio marinus]|uniref:CLUMA_CG003595, isoform A n=1 Tax=Clunio marinus TaxID=568069 RepID=A0A1J1HP54_9DIPT|nr:CLUMA_CG003595, isoform A [Clunio marinus]
MSFENSNLLVKVPCLYTVASKYFACLAHIEVIKKEQKCANEFTNKASIRPHSDEWFFSFSFIC